MRSKYDCDENIYTNPPRLIEVKTHNNLYGLRICDMHVHYTKLMTFFNCL